MRAVVITEPGVLELRDVPDPEPGPEEIRIRVQAAGINRADLLQREGVYPAPAGAPPDIPGLEYAGVVDAVGERVSVWSVGERVMGLVAGGGYAEYVVVPADQALAIPEAIDTVTAAAIPEAYITAHDALRTRLGVFQGETVLVHAIGSGVGTAALQLAGGWNVRVAGTSRTPWKLERAEALGMETGVRAEEGAFADAVLAATRGRGVDAILDLVGGDYLTGDVECVAYRGRIVVVGLTGGRRATLDLGALLSKRLTVMGTVLRSRSAAEKAAAARAFCEDGLPLLARGVASPVIHEVLPMEEAARGHALLASNETFGNLVLSW
jgi:NADPH2:quinone reductase